MKTSILRSSKSFIRGVGSVMDIYPSKKYVIKSYRGKKTDSQRLTEDWNKVGKTISDVMVNQNHAKQ